MTPKQIAFYDFESNTWLGGILHNGEIICLECGAVINVYDYLDSAKEFGCTFDPIRTLEWVSLSEECLGDLVFSTES